MLYRLSYVGGAQPDSICCKLMANPMARMVNATDEIGGFEAWKAAGLPVRT
jgi:hypothetical protein